MTDALSSELEALIKAAVENATKKQTVGKNERFTSMVRQSLDQAVRASAMQMLIYKEEKPGRPDSVKESLMKAVMRGVEVDEKDQQAIFDHIFPK